MSNTLNDLQLKLTNQVAPVLEEDRYFGYLLGLIGEGENEIDQQSVIMRKTVDEEWLTEIEEALPSVFKVIQAPRRFLKNTEEVVPVDLARKITADSVRHLSQNTQFIASNEEGNVQPTRVLNVTVEETYDLYENRFIYHLIQRLITFVDKRTDVIFWSTGDNKYDSLKFSSKFQDETEEVEYELSFKIKNLQDNSAEKKENMDVFMRIDRLRKQVMQLRRSPFCEIMNGCAKVRSPIQRTNLIMKDPDYRRCFQLWQFIERYDGIGYKIEEEKKALQFDEDYLYQFYDYIAVNYANFKSILSPDGRSEETILKQKRKSGRRPKFIKSVKEEFVDSPNIEEVEIRKVFVEFVTQAQLDAEAKAAEAIAKAEQAEARAAAAEAEAKRVKEEADALVAKTKADAEAAIAKAQAEAEAEVARIKAETDAIVADTKAKAEAEIAETKAEAIATVTAIRAESDAIVAETKSTAEAEIAEAKRISDSRIAEAERYAAEQITEAKASADAIVAETKANANALIADIKADADRLVAKAQEEVQEKLAVMEAQVNSALASKTLAQQNEGEAREQAKKALDEASNIMANAKRTAEEADQRAALATEEKEQMRVSMDAAMAHADEAISLKKLAEEARDQAIESAKLKLAEAKSLSEHAEKTKAYAMTQVEAANKALDEAAKLKAQLELAAKDVERKALQKVRETQNLNLIQYMALRREEKKLEKQKK